MLESGLKDDVIVPVDRAAGVLTSAGHVKSPVMSMVILSIFSSSFHLSSLFFHFTPNTLYPFSQLPTAFSGENIASEIYTYLTV